jgi:hypothetical protein
MDGRRTLDGMSGQVETLMGYSGGTMSRLFAATSTGDIWATREESHLDAEDGSILTTEAGDEFLITTTAINISGLRTGAGSSSTSRPLGAAISTS